ncbi:hypothetical protein E4T44_04936 [Aureobasidium sp. EXF-8845]|nr:hypothetical protein E4T44_04936 [Aureobasidium sp. EXF-8845]KAI4849793.1 hypothetical protein E4T45_05772 [Aureobasidium sp. EXF-8846]
MCQYENIHYGCGHAARRLIKHCHFARNDPNHQCFGAWSVKREWSNPTEYCRNYRGVMVMLVENLVVALDVGQDQLLVLV